MRHKIYGLLSPRRGEERELDVDILPLNIVDISIELGTSLPLGIWPHHIAPLMQEDDASITITNQFFTCHPLLNLDTPLPLNVHKFLFRAIMDFE